MTTIKINSGCRQFKKENDGMKKAMYKALEHLIHMIETAVCNMNLIFNNEKIIYDRINKICLYSKHEALTILS